jgi:amino acid adenylation domain-containing protein
MVVALLAIHKAGGAYVPLDPTFPRERLTMIAEDAGLDVLVTQGPLVGELPDVGCKLLVLDHDATALADSDPSDLGIPVGPTDLAYVIFTSGSTGRPKGVEIPHVALGNLLESMQRRPGLDARDALLAVTTISFDIAGLELFLPLVTGATLVLAGEDEAVDAMWLRDRLGVGDISVMQATPATWQMLLDAGWMGTPGLRALCGGEALGPELAAAMAPRVGSLWNMYGPTETTIWSSVAEVDPRLPVSLGEPIANTEFYVLDPGLEPQPPGIPGELYIGGLGLARGYRARPDLTSERFITHRFDDEPPRRLYRTGDVVRRMADGRIEYVGRADSQVKIRGFRIELGEIETVLGRHPDVRECVVVARDVGGHGKRLVAYLIPVVGGLEVSGLRAYLRETLPDYMLPALFVELDAFPLTANRKVDRARLPDPGGDRPDLAIAYVAPTTEAEAALARVWEEFLGVERVGIHDNFFDLGGDSLLALRTVMRANRDGVRLTTDSIFRHQTIAELATTLDGADHLAADQGLVLGPTPLTPAQLRFVTQRTLQGHHHWNISTIVQTETLDPSALAAAVDALVRHHDALRLRVRQVGDAWRQEISPPPPAAPFESHDLLGLATSDRAAAIERVCSALQGSLDLEQGPLFRVAHFACGPGESDRVFLTVHHLAVDGLTFGVLLEDLERAYRQARDGRPIALPSKTTSFQTWSTRLRDLARDGEVTRTAAAWLQLPWDDVAAVPVRPGADRSRNTNASARAVTLELDATETELLLRGDVRPEHAILAALAHGLARWTGSDTVLIDVLSHGRDAAVTSANVARTVGFMLSYNPVVLTHRTWQDGPGLMPDLLRQVDALPAGYTFDLLRFLSPDADLRRRLNALPRADLLFNYAGEDVDLDGASSWRPATEPIGPDRSSQGLREHPIAVRAALVPNLQLTFVYSRELHEPNVIEAVASDVRWTIRRLLETPVLLA